MLNRRSTGKGKRVIETHCDCHCDRGVYSHAIVAADDGGWLVQCVDFRTDSMFRPLGECHCFHTAEIRQALEDAGIAFPESDQGSLL